MAEKSKNIALREVLNYLKNPKNILDAKEGRVCGDGRYGNTYGMLGRFGADAGYVLGILALKKLYNLNISSEQVVNAVFNAITLGGGKFYAHSDSHDEITSPYSIGCGHLTKAAELSKDYSLEENDGKKAIFAIKKLAATKPDQVVIAELQGDHMEKGVIFNTGVVKKIAHRNGDNQYFMVDSTRDIKYIDQLFPRLLRILPILSERGVTISDFKYILQKQTLATAHILAKGLPIFEVNADLKNRKIKQIGLVE